MTKIKRKWDMLNKDKRSFCIREIMRHFDKEHDEKIGVIIAEDHLDFFLELLSEEIHNIGIEDAKNLLRDRFEDLEIDLDLLKSK